MRTRAKDKLFQGEVVSFINPDYPSAGLVEYLGGLGIDAIFIDCEHGNAGFEKVEDMARAARLTGAAAIVRPGSQEPWLITRYLDRNIDGLIVPHIDTAAQAQTLVKTVQYARPGDHRDKLIIAQIESPEAVDNLPEILAVDGIDVYFIGPGDLSSTMDYPGQMDHPEVEATIDRARRTILEANKIAGILVNPGNIEARIQQGYRMLYEHARTFMQQGAANFLRRIEGTTK